MDQKNIIVIGSSTGGPKILRKIFSNLPPLNATIILVQHIPKFVNESLVEILNKETGMEVKIAENGKDLENKNAYFAPSEIHLKILDNRQINLCDGERVNYVCPSIDITMKSIKKSKTDKIVGIVLTGMGKDGAAGITHIKGIGGITIAQDEQTSIVYGMPKKAYETGNVDLVLTPEEIRNKLITWLG